MSTTRAKKVGNILEWEEQQATADEMARQCQKAFETETREDRERAMDAIHRYFQKRAEVKE